MAVVVPHGVLFRGGAEGTIREGILRQDLVEGVIGLADNLFYGTGIPAAILFINRNKPKSHKRKVLLINGTAEVVDGRNQNHLSEANVNRMAKAFHAYAHQARFCRVVELADLERNNFNLNITRYVQTAEDEAAVDVGAEVKQLRKLVAQRNAAEAAMNAFLEELGYGS
jgi:type I restriction enzyme M protein